MPNGMQNSTVFWSITTLEDTRPYLFGLLGLPEADDLLAQMDGQIKNRRTLEAIKQILLR